MFLRGDLKRAEATHADALALNRELGDKAGQAYDIQRLGDVAAARGDLRAAEKQYDRAMELQKELGDDLGQAECRLGTAAVKIADGRFADAEPLLRDAEETFRTQGATDRQAVALAVLLDSLLAQGKIGETKAPGDALGKLVESTKDRLARWEGSMALARLRALSGKPPDVQAALASLESVRAEAARAGFLLPQLESRLLTGRLEMSSGNASSGRTRLKALAAEAEAKGFGSIAKRARESAR
jgi:tetratricopeptide (TPR) repeat protein